MDPIEYLRSLGGVARTGALLRAGFTRREIGSLEGRALRPRKGLWALPDANPDFLFALMRDGLITCGSAASYHGLWIRSAPDRRHLATRHARAQDCVSHRKLLFPPHHDVPLVSVEDALIHALGCLDAPQAVSMVESAARAGRVKRETLWTALDSRADARARKVLAQVIFDADRQAQSQPEVEARLLFLAQGWEVETQVWLPGVGAVDFRIERVLPVEIDGFTYHGDRKSFAKDRYRMNAALLQGQPTLRYLPERIWYDCRSVVDEIARVLELWPRFLL